jgi:hypothetical protein
MPILGKVLKTRGLVGMRDLAGMLGNVFQGRCEQTIRCFARDVHDITGHQ